MREIKFRAWDKNTKIMIHWDDLVKSRISFRNFRWALLSENSENFELMQYTGIKDANGIEVYDGDVITAYFDAINGQYLITYTVKFDEFHSLYPFEDFDRYEGPMHFTVIGNRYENPELLKE